MKKVNQLCFEHWANVNNVDIDVEKLYKDIYDIYGVDSNDIFHVYVTEEKAMDLIDNVVKNVKNIKECYYKPSIYKRNEYDKCNIRCCLLFNRIDNNEAYYDSGITFFNNKFFEFKSVIVVKNMMIYIHEVYEGIYIRIIYWNQEGD